MKFAVVGCGALGSYYGARLETAGQEVHFLLRSDFEVVRQKGVTIHSPGETFTVHPHAACRPEQIGRADVVIIGLKSTANQCFAELLPPLVDQRTILLTLQNGLGNEEQLARIFPPGQIMGGLCFVCLNRIEPGVIQHLAHGRVVMGEFRRPPQQRTRQLRDLFQRAGVPCTMADDLEQAHWEKLVWNIPFNGLGVASAAGYEAAAGTSGRVEIPASLQPCLTTDLLLGDSRWEQLVRELMHEVIDAANAKRLKIDGTLANKMIERTRSMGAYRASTLVDFERGQPLELESLFHEPLRQAEAAEVNVPRLKRLCEVLRALDARNASCGK